jgi:hypothetical protein
MSPQVVGIGGRLRRGLATANPRDCREDPRVYLRGSPGPVDHAPPGGIGGSQTTKALGDAFVKLHRLAFHAIRGCFTAGATNRRRRVEQNKHVGLKPLGGKPIDLTRNVEP